MIFKTLLKVGNMRKSRKHQASRKVGSSLKKQEIDCKIGNTKCRKHYKNQANGIYLGNCWLSKKVLKYYWKYVTLK